MTEPINIHALQSLGELLEQEGISFGAIVIGGANLVVAGIVDRSTMDVDVIAQRGDDGTIRPALPIPPAIEAAARRVAELRDLDENWFNADAALIFGGHFPVGFQTRLRPERFGGLTVWWVAPEDLVAFKLYASVKTIDRPGPNRHRQDLEHLELDQARITAAVEWITAIVPEGSRKLDVLAGIVVEFGYEY